LAAADVGQINPTPSGTEPIRMRLDRRVVLNVQLGRHVELVNITREFDV